MDAKKQKIKNLRALIEASGKQKKQIAEEIGMSRSTISDYLSGRVSPTIFILPKLCKSLDCTYEDIIGKI